MLLIGLMWPYNVYISFLLLNVFQIFIFLSQLPEAINFESELIDTFKTRSLCPINVFSTYPVSKFTILIVLSQLPVIINFPFLLITRV